MHASVARRAGNWPGVTSLTGSNAFISPTAGFRMHFSRASKRGFNGRIAILRHIALTGRTIAGDPVWSTGELAALRLHYPDKQAIASALVRRSKIAIQHKARSLGLRARRLDCARSKTDGSMIAGTSMRTCSPSGFSGRGNRSTRSISPSFENRSKSARSKSRWLQASDTLAKGVGNNQYG